MIYSPAFDGLPASVKERVYRLEDEPGYNPNDLLQAMERAYEWGDRIPLGLFFQSERPTYEDTEPAFKRGPAVDQPLGLSQETFDRLLAESM